jgi:choline dehydrogenase-like flavoprotein
MYPPGLPSMARDLGVKTAVKALRDWIRSTLYSYPHVAGTCAIGSVVDTTGRVHGTDRLSVIDASIMPDMVSGYTHFPTIMIAERLAEQIAR